MIARAPHRRSLLKGAGLAALIGTVLLCGWSIYAQDSATRPNRIPVGSYSQTMYGLLSPESVRRAEPEVRKRLRQMAVRPIRNAPTLAADSVPAREARIGADTRVVGVTLNGVSKAYALSLPQRYTLLAGINDEVGGRKILVTH